MTNTTILVIGSTGKTGKRVADQREKRGITVRHGSRSADIPFDWDNPQSWPAALEGVDKVYLTYYPDLAVPGSVDAVSTLTELAKDAGVSRLVLLSGRNEAEAEKAERVVMAFRAGLDDRAVCVLRAELQGGRVTRRHRGRRGGRADRRPARPQTETSASCRCRSTSTSRCSRNTVCHKTSSDC
jgi:hypothetical protein